VLARVECDVLIMAAAVADFTPTETSSQKIKKSAGAPVIQLMNTADILSEVAEKKAQTGYPRYVIGFAAESQELAANAHQKLQAKRLDLLVANDISIPDAGFEVDTNRVTLFYAGGRAQEYPVMKKSEVAETVIAQITEWIG
jgi:phosphopantothenoylcysteine decarboxylase / phosphopantothenate---cysteine ligase